MARKKRAWNKGRFKTWGLKSLNTGPDKGLLKSVTGSIKSFARDERIPDTKKFYLVSTVGENAMPRAHVFDKLKKIEKYDPHRKFLKEDIYNTEEEILMLFFSLDQHFFMKVNKKTGVGKRSILYNGRDRALFVYMQNQITWSDTFQMSHKIE